MDRYFPVIKIHGTAEDRGRQHGTLLKERIHRTIEFYQKQFQLPEQEILRHCRPIPKINRGLPRGYIYRNRSPGSSRRDRSALDLCVKRSHRAAEPQPDGMYHPGFQETEADRPELGLGQ